MKRCGPRRGPRPRIPPSRPSRARHFWGLLAHERNRAVTPLAYVCALDCGAQGIALDLSPAAGSPARPTGAYDQTGEADARETSQVPHRAARRRWRVDAPRGRARLGGPIDRACGAAGAIPSRPCLAALRHDDARLRRVRDRCHLRAPRAGIRRPPLRFPPRHRHPLRVRHPRARKCRRRHPAGRRLLFLREPPRPDPPLQARLGRAMHRRGGREERLLLQQLHEPRVRGGESGDGRSLPQWRPGLGWRRHRLFRRERHRRQRRLQRGNRRLRSTPFRDPRRRRLPAARDPSPRRAALCGQRRKHAPGRCHEHRRHRPAPARGRRDCGAPTVRGTRSGPGGGGGLRQRERHPTAGGPACLRCARVGTPSTR